MYQKKDYSFVLPKELIAEIAENPQHNAKLIVLKRETGEILAESTFWNLDAYIPADRVLFFNNSRVLRSRITLKNTPYTGAEKSEKILKE